MVMSNWGFYDVTVASTLMLKWKEMVTYFVGKRDKGRSNSSWEEGVSFRVSANPFVCWFLNYTLGFGYRTLGDTLVAVATELSRTREVYKHCHRCTIRSTKRMEQKIETSSRMQFKVKMLQNYMPQVCPADGTGFPLQVIPWRPRCWELPCWGDSMWVPIKLCRSSWALQCCSIFHIISSASPWNHWMKSSRDLG